MSWRHIQCLYDSRDYTRLAIINIYAILRVGTANDARGGAASPILWRGEWICGFPPIQTRDRHNFLSASAPCSARTMTCTTWCLTAFESVPFRLRWRLSDHEKTSLAQVH